MFSEVNACDLLTNFYDAHDAQQTQEAMMTTQVQPVCVFASATAPLTVTQQDALRDAQLEAHNREQVRVAHAEMQRRDREDREAEMVPNAQRLQKRLQEWGPNAQAARRADREFWEVEDALRDAYDVQERNALNASSTGTLVPQSAPQPRFVQVVFV